MSGVPEARIARNENGAVPEGPGWYVVNAADREWLQHDELGSAVIFEPGEGESPQYGVNIQVLQPGQPNCMYHGEEGQENFLVLWGECLLLVEGQERRLRQWDFVHCPPWTRHVFVGAGERPCGILMIGARFAGDGIVYPVDGVARRHGAGVEQETQDPREAYAPYDRPAPVPYPGSLPTG